MKIQTKEIYKCSYCYKLYQIKSACIKHELSCKKRPDYFRPCYDCMNAIKINVKAKHTYINEQTGDYVDGTVKIIFCKAKQCGIYPLSVAVKDNAWKLLDYDNVPMPTECDLFKPVSTLKEFFEKIKQS